MTHTVPTSDVAARAFSAAALKDIAVHLDGTPEDENRLAHAEALATRFGARLTGLYTNALPDPALYAGDFGMSAIGQLAEASAAEGNSVEARLKERLSRLSVPHELRRLEAFPGALEQAAVTEARWADLFVASCPRGGDDLDRWSPLVERVLFDSGRGLYLVPAGIKPREAARTILIGWVDGRPSVRAMAEAMPFIGLGSDVHVVTVQEQAHGRMGGAEALADIAAHLGRHGVRATATVLTNGIAPAEALLGEARRVSADLLVVGAYGHSRFREWVLGGVTEDLLATADLPMLMAN